MRKKLPDETYWFEFPIRLIGCRATDWQKTEKTKRGMHFSMKPTDFTGCTTLKAPTSIHDNVSRILVRTDTVSEFLDEMSNYYLIPYECKRIEDPHIKEVCSKIGFDKRTLHKSRYIRGYKRKFDIIIYPKPTSKGAIEDLEKKGVINEYQSREIKNRIDSLTTTDVEKYGKDFEKELGMMRKMFK